MRNSDFRGCSNKKEQLSVKKTGLVVCQYRSVYPHSRIDIPISRSYIKSLAIRLPGLRLSVN